MRRLFVGYWERLLKDDGFAGAIFRGFFYLAFWAFLLSVLAVIGAFVLVFTTHKVAALVFVLRAFGWLITACGAVFVLGVFLLWWQDLVSQRQKKERKGKAGITLREMLGRTIDFERWCE